MFPLQGKRNQCNCKRTSADALLCAFPQRTRTFERTLVAPLGLNHLSNSFLAAFVHGFVHAHAYFCTSPCKLPCQGISTRFPIAGRSGWGCWAGHRYHGPGHPSVILRPSTRECSAVYCTLLLIYHTCLNINSGEVRK